MSAFLFDVSLGELSLLNSRSNVQVIGEVFKVLKVRARAERGDRERTGTFCFSESLGQEIKTMDMKISWSVTTLPTFHLVLGAEGV